MIRLARLLGYFRFRGSLDGLQLSLRTAALALRLLSTSPHGDAVAGALQLNDLIRCGWSFTSRVVGFRVRTESHESAQIPDDETKIRRANSCLTIPVRPNRSVSIRVDSCDSR